MSGTFQDLRLTPSRVGMEARRSLGRVGHLRALHRPSMSGLGVADEQLVRRISSLTLLPADRLISLMTHVDVVIKEGVPGDFVECGVWRGGASFLMALRAEAAGIRDRTVWMFDSFEGLPAPTVRDGRRARSWARGGSSQTLLDNCRVDEVEVRTAAADLGLTKRVRIVKGWFEDSLPKLLDEVGEVSILRIDCDWYESVRTCLSLMFHVVTPGGLVILDDYYDWRGCAAAVHDFLRECRVPLRVRRDGSCAIIRIPDAS